jgi:hypothetical protein
VKIAQSSNFQVQIKNYAFEILIRNLEVAFATDLLICHKSNIPLAHINDSVSPNYF